VHRQVPRLLAALVVVGLGGCSELLEPFQPESPPPQPAHAAKYVPPSVVTPAYSEDEVPPPPVHKRATSRTAHPASPAPPPPAAVASLPSGNSNEDANSKPSLTLDGEDDSRASAETLLYKVDKRLAVIDRTKLTAADAATFDEANGFASSAHRALADHDYVVASGLAEKASTLTGRLNVSKRRE
jgi:type IV secretory pathway VirB10-like protein